jgi:hypothetical protein
VIIHNLIRPNLKKKLYPHFFFLYGIYLELQVCVCVIVYSLEKMFGGTELLSGYLPHFRILDVD